MPDALVALVAHEVLVEVLGIELAPLGSSPCGEVYTVGDVAYVILLWIVAFPDGGEHLLAHPSVQFAHAVDLLTGVACERRHAETLRVVIGILTPHADKLIP